MGGKGGSDSSMVTTSYRILCHDMKAGGVIGKSGSIIKAIRQHTGAWINVHELMPGDEERIIEISDTRRRDPDGRMPAFSPAQEALFLIHERILESEGFVDGEGDYGGPGRGGMGGGGNNNGRVVTRLVVSRMHVGSLLGKGGKIIEQMRIETKTQIRILPRDHTLPRCVSMGEEIVQVVGDVIAVKSAISIISSRLRESQHRDRSQYQGRYNSEERFIEEDFIPHMNRRSSMGNDGSPYSSRLLSNSSNSRGSNYPSRSGGYMYESEGATRTENFQPSFEVLVFRILCPNDRVDSVVGDSNGIMDILQNEIGVDIKVSELADGSEEQIIIVSSNEGPDDELFPAQEALLHIQSRIVDLIPDKDNIITTRLLIACTDIACLNEGDVTLSEMKKLTGADIEVLPREKVPSFISGSDELVQIVGEIKAAREALVEVTARLRSFLYKEFFQRDMLPPPDPAPGSLGNGPSGPESVNIPPPAYESLASESPAVISQSVQTAAAGQPNKDAGLSSSETSRQNESDRREDSASSRREDTPTSLNSGRIQVPMVTRSTLEVVIPEYAVTRLLGKSKNKLAQISELSGANVTLIDDGPELTEKVIRIRGTPEQAERAQSLLQGFFLSIQEDAP